MNREESGCELLKQIRISQELIAQMEIQALKHDDAENEWIEMIELEKNNLAAYREELGELYALPL